MELANGSLPTFKDAVIGLVSDKARRLQIAWRVPEVSSLLIVERLDAAQLL